MAAKTKKPEKSVLTAEQNRLNDNKENGVNGKSGVHI